MKWTRGYGCNARVAELNPGVWISCVARLAQAVVKIPMARRVRGLFPFLSHIVHVKTEAISDGCTFVGVTHLALALGTQRTPQASTLPENSYRTASPGRSGPGSLDPVLRATRLAAANVQYYRPPRLLRAGQFCGRSQLSLELRSVPW